MAWKPPTQKAFDAGEIPGKREISDEEMANLEKYRPEKDVDAMFGGVTAGVPGGPNVVMIPPGQGITIPIGGSPTSGIQFDPAIVDFLDDLQTQKDFGKGEVVLTTDFPIIMEAEISAAGKPWDVEDVLEVSYSRELTPPLFYFGIDMIHGELKVVMTPVANWDQLGCLDDRSLSDYILPSFLSRDQESVYNIDQNTTASKVRIEMVKMGFVEKHEIAAYFASLCS